MATKGLTYKHATQVMRQKRPQHQLNLGFHQQLQRFEGLLEQHGNYLEPAHITEAMVANLKPGDGFLVLSPNPSQRMTSGTMQRPQLPTLTVSCTEKSALVSVRSTLALLAVLLAVLSTLAE